MLTHRQFSRNSASSRAIPVKKMIERIKADPVYPLNFNSNQPGMQSGPPLPEQVVAKSMWEKAMNASLDAAESLADFGAHKETVNRLIEPFSWMTTIISATDWDNFFKLRSTSFSGMAQPELAKIADMMLESYKRSIPDDVDYGNWHLPLTYDYEGLYLADRKKVSVARCARVSYLTHDGKRDAEKDIELYERLLNDHHMSPFEHVAIPATSNTDGNFTGWSQLRHFVS